MSARGAFLAAMVATACAACALCAGCHAPPSSDRLEGRWIGLRAEGVGLDAGLEAAAAANAFATSTELEFQRNEITVTAAQETQLGRYMLVREGPNDVVIATDKDGPGHPQTFVFAGDETMRWTLPEGKSIVFARE
jgi:hypothetical protein